MANKAKPFDPRRPNGDEAKAGAGAASTITSGNIRDAYIFEDRRAQRRIEAYGRLNRKIFNELIVHEPASHS